MIDQSVFSSIENSLSTSRTVFILLPQNPNLDKIAASLALFLSLKKTGKEPLIACSTPMRVEFSDLVGVDRIATKLTGRNLVISFDYAEDSIDKVSYNIENHNFNIVIQTNVGYPPLATDKVRYSYSGGEADLIFVVGSQDLKSLGQLQNELSNPGKQTIINLDTGSNNGQFGKVNLIDSTASSCCELVTQLLSQIKLPVDEDIATNLLLGIERETQGFTSPRVNATTFEAAAFCLRSGGRSTRRGFHEARRRKNISQPLVEEKVAPEQKPSQPSPDWYQPKVYSGNTKI